ncbi:MAG: Holliday junction resolvase RuvX [Proteobacteria bacterium]|nr:Holliday junction resolvase RuvX [Pseudomonadota bacterium]
MEKGKKIMALDLGTKRIGVAMTDETLLLAQPYCVLKREGNKKDIPKIIRIIASENIGKIVMGLPISEKKSTMFESVKRFCEQLKDFTDIPVEYIDETMTTASAKEILKIAGYSEKKGRQIIDMLSAVKILESYLRSAEDKK